MKYCVIKILAAKQKQNLTVCESSHYARFAHHYWPHHCRIGENRLWCTFTTGYELENEKNDWILKLVLGFWRMAWSFCFKVSNKHPLLWFCCLISFILMATLLDSHSSSFSILESTFPIGHLCKAQIVVNPSSKRLVSLNTFKILANYMVVKIIVSMWCFN